MLIPKLNSLSQSHTRSHLTTYSSIDSLYSIFICKVFEIDIFYFFMPHILDF